MLCARLAPFAPVPGGPSLMRLMLLPRLLRTGGRAAASTVAHRSRRIIRERERQLKKVVTGLSRDEMAGMHRLLQRRLQQEALLEAHVAPPTQSQLRRLVMQEMMPFIGFGFLDNAIMIIAGEYIDTTLGVTLGISTMAAAALGNWVSDLSGIGLGNVVGVACSRLGLPSAALTSDQVDHPSARRATFTGRSIGITIGCFLGMFPLLFLKGKEKDVEDY